MVGENIKQMPPQRAIKKKQRPAISIKNKMPIETPSGWIDAPMARVTDLGDGIVRVEWNPIYSPTQAVVVYTRCRVVSVEQAKKLKHRRTLRKIKSPQASKRLLADNKQDLVYDLISEFAASK